MVSIWSLGSLRSLRSLRSLQSLHWWFPLTFCDRWRSFTIATIAEIDSDSIPAIVIVAIVGSRWDRWRSLANENLVSIWSLRSLNTLLAIPAIVSDRQRSYGNQALPFSSLTIHGQQNFVKEVRIKVQFSELSGKTMENLILSKGLTLRASFEDVFCINYMSDHRALMCRLTSTSLGWRSRVNSGADLGGTFIVLDVTALAFAEIVNKRDRTLRETG